MLFSYPRLTRNCIHTAETRGDTSDTFWANRYCMYTQKYEKEDPWKIKTHSDMRMTSQSVFQIIYSKMFL